MSTKEVGAKNALGLWIPLLLLALMYEYMKGRSSTRHTWRDFSEMPGQITDAEVNGSIRDRNSVSQSRKIWSPVEVAIT